MFERFTQAARTAVVQAQTHARQGGHPQIGAEDVLMGVLEDEQGPTARALREVGLADRTTLGGEPTFAPADRDALESIGIDLDAVRRQAELTFGPGALDRPRRQRPGLFGRRSVGGHIPFSNEAKRSLEQALRAALAERHNYIGTEHLFLGLLAADEKTTLAVLRRLGVTEGRTTLERRVLAQLNRSV